MEQSSEEQYIKVGDKIKFSAELIKDIDKMKDGETYLVEVVEIRQTKEGHKFLVVGREYKVDHHER